MVYVHSGGVSHGNDGRIKREVLEGTLPERGMRVREAGDLGTRAQRAGVGLGAGQYAHSLIPKTVERSA